MKSLIAVLLFIYIVDLTLGNEVTAISTSPNKEETARKIGADR